MRYLHLIANTIITIPVALILFIILVIALLATTAESIFNFLLEKYNDFNC